MAATPVEQFRQALQEGSATAVRRLLEQHADVRAAVNAPIWYFEGRPVMAAKKNLPLLDVLLEYGADLNLKSAWWAGGFGVLEYDCAREQAEPLIARGAVVDIFAAAHLGMFDRVRELVASDPSLVTARGGDGKTALHCARTIEIAQFLLDRGAEIDARDVDHESTAAQYLAREAPDVTRLLVDRGARFDIFIAVALRDRDLVERCLREDPGALDHRAGQGLYAVAHNNARPSTPEEIGIRRGDIYRWVFNHNASATDVAVSLGYDDIVALLLQHATPAQQLIAACTRADAVQARAIVSANPGVIASLRDDQKRVMPDRAFANDAASVGLMLELGFDPRPVGHDAGDALHWAAFHGNARMVELLLRHDPAIGARDAHHGGTPLGWCLYGALHGWSQPKGDHPATVKLLLDAGEKLDPAVVPTGRDDVDAVLRAHLTRASDAR